MSWHAGHGLMRKFAPALDFSHVKKASFDILHYHGDDFLAPGARNRVRTFYGSAFFEATGARKPTRFFYQTIFYLLELVSCVRKGTKVGISEATRVPLIGVEHVIPCGVPLNIYRPVRAKSEAPSILFIGDLGSRKRGDLLLRLFSEHVLPLQPTCTLAVVGPEPCEGRNVRYLGNIPEEHLVREYQEAWIYCMPSSYEGFGVPAIEAMACGTAVVASGNRGIAEIVQQNYNGLLSAEGGLADSVNRVLSDETLRNRLAGNALRTVVRKYDINLIAREYETIYRSVGV